MPFIINLWYMLILSKLINMKYPNFHHHNHLTCPSDLSTYLKEQQEQPWALFHLAEADLEATNCYKLLLGQSYV